MSNYISFECPKHGWSDVDTSAVGCPACEIDHIQRERAMAQIDVLEELLAGRVGHWIVRASAKIAQLQKGLS